MFSLNRLFGEALLPEGQTYSFWGKGLSQGHSDAVRRVPGVAAGVQYTIPADDAIAAVRSEEHTSELQSRGHLVCRLLLGKKKIVNNDHMRTRGNPHAH